MSGTPRGIFKEAGISGFYRDDSLSRVGSVTVSYKPTGLFIFVSSFIGVVIFSERSCIYYKPKNHLPTTSLLTTEKNDQGRGWNEKKETKEKRRDIEQSRLEAFRTTMEPPTTMSAFDYDQNKGTRETAL